jgi:predicted SnoaL-like aldol condensation-catalyzing enzyme
MDKSEKRNVQTILNAFDTLFNRRDCATAERFWSSSYIQHSAHIPPGRDGLFNLVKAMPDTLHCENYVAAASGDSLSFMDVSTVLASGRHGSSATSCEWRTGCLRSTGT